MKYREKKSLLLSDYTYEVLRYGISGASCKFLWQLTTKMLYLNFNTGHNCWLYREISTHNMKIPLRERGSYPSRTLHSLQRDYLEFCSKGGRHLKNAKHHNNVIIPYNLSSS